MKNSLIVAIAAALLLLAGCSVFDPVNGQIGIVPPLCNGCYYVSDTTDGLPLLSTPHRLLVYRDDKGEHWLPENSQPSIFSALQNVPVTAGGMLQSTGGAALGAH
jgi:hypothetical protein